MLPAGKLNNGEYSFDVPRDGYKFVATISAQNDDFAVYLSNGSDTEIKPLLISFGNADEVYIKKYISSEGEFFDVSQEEVFSWSVFQAIHNLSKLAKYHFGKEPKPGLKVIANSTGTFYTFGNHRHQIHLHAMTPTTIRRRRPKWRLARRWRPGWGWSCRGLRNMRARCRRWRDFWGRR